MSVTRGGMLLVGAQLWHALTGYVIFRVATETLGDSGYGAFTTVLWTMTTLEVLVTEGLPRAFAVRVASHAAQGVQTLRRTLLRTHGVALLLCALLCAAAPFLAGIWQAPELASAVCLSALDFLTFAGFAVFAALANGLRRFAVQARIQFAYSTLKVLIVCAVLWSTRSVAGAMAGYALASGCGSVLAWLQARRLTTDDSAATPSADRPDGAVFAAQSLLLMLLVNLDLWAGAVFAGAQSARLGLYAMAATLCRSVYFVLRAVGEALLPGVAHAHGRGDRVAVRNIIRRGLSLLFVLLLPCCAVGMACGASALKLLFGAEQHGTASTFLPALLSSAACCTLMAVQVAVLNAVQRSGAALTLICAALIVQLAACGFASGSGDLGTLAVSVAAGSALTMLAGFVLLVRACGSVVPFVALFVSAGLAPVEYAAASFWQPEGWWVFAWGALMCAISVAGAVLCGVVHLQDREPAALPPGSN